MSIVSLIRRFGRPLTVKRKQSGTTDDMGGPIEAFTDAVLTGYIKVKSGSDPVVAGREIRQRSVTVYFEGEADIEFEDRVVYDSSTFEVRSVRQPDERMSRDALQYTIVEMEQTI
mgnify:CR=1 FL=1